MHLCTTTDFHPTSLVMTRSLFGKARMAQAPNQESGSSRMEQTNMQEYILIVLHKHEQDIQEIKILLGNITNVLSRLMTTQEQAQIAAHMSTLGAQPQIHLASHLIPNSLPTPLTLGAQPHIHLASHIVPNLLPALRKVRAPQKVRVPPRNFTPLTYTLSELLPFLL